MRAFVRTPLVTLTPSTPARVEVEVTNDFDAIEGVRASLEAGPDVVVEVDPPLLALFPDDTAILTLLITAGPNFEAGQHQLPLTLYSSVDPAGSISETITVDVQPAPKTSIEVVPPVRRGYRRARYAVVISNSGNTTVDASLAGTDPDRALTVRFDHPGVTVGPGEICTTSMTVRGGRLLYGADRPRIVSVAMTSPGSALDTAAAFRHRPMIPSGVRTLVILGIIVVAWAAIFVVALDHAFAQDPLTKDVPPSFYAASSAAHTATGRSALGSLGAFRYETADSPALPPGAVPKSGVVIGIGGTISGTVTAGSTGSGIGRITVEAVRTAPRGPVLVASAATASDGTFSIVGLLPGSYFLHLTALGYYDTWYTGQATCAPPPGTTTIGSATPVSVDATQPTPSVNACIAGQPATIKGTVLTGSNSPETATITVFPQQGSTTPIATVTTDAAGDYTIPNLPAPGTYDLSINAAGYKVASDTEDVSGGEGHTATTINLDANTGTLGGTVTDGTNPLGGTTVTAAANGQTYTSATPTVGAVGQFTIANLPTPATYLLTFTKAGYATVTIAQALGPGQSLNDMTVPMAGGAGQVSGTVKSSTGAPLGGVTVTVNGGSQAISTQTLTAGQVGTYHLSGLTTPGSYTLTFSLSGYTSETLGVSLQSGGSDQGVDATMTANTGIITGTVTKAAGGGLAGATVTITDGTNVHTTTTTSSPAGGFSVSALPAGAYSVTFSMPGYSNQTALVQLGPNQTQTVNVTMTPET